MTAYPHYVMRRTWDFFRNGDLRHEYIGTIALTAYPPYARTFTDLTAAKEAAHAPGFRPVLRVVADLATPCAVCKGARMVFTAGHFWDEAEPCPSCGPNREAGQ